MAGANSRVQTRSEPEGDGSSEACGRQEFPGELVVAWSDAPEVLEATEHRLDPPTGLVATLIVLDRSLAVASTWDDRDRALLAQGSPVATVSDQQVSAFHIRGIAGRQDDAKGPSEDIDKGVDLRRPAAKRDANGIGPRPPFAPQAVRWALM